MKNIALIYGSDSSESDVSVRSGEFVSSQLDSSRYNVFEIFARFGSWTLVAWRLGSSERTVIPEGSRPEIDKTDFSVTFDAIPGKVKFDYAYIMQHGTPGENGLMQGYLKMLGVPFNTCSAFVAAVTFDKFSCKSYLRGLPWIKCAKDVFLRKGQSYDPASWVRELGLPMFVKPTDGGSSFGVTKVKKEEDIPAAVEAAFKEGDTLIAESAIVGREITCAVYMNKGVVETLPVIEIVPHTEWFDYEAKYNGLSDEICPAPLDAETFAHVQEVSRRIYVQLGCEGLVRVDYILSEDGLYFLEMNTVPGMTSASLVPKMSLTAGLPVTELLNRIIDSGASKTTSHADNCKKLQMKSVWW